MATLRLANDELEMLVHTYPLYQYLLLLHGTLRTVFFGIGMEGRLFPFSLDRCSGARKMVNSGKQNLVPTEDWQ